MRATLGTLLSAQVICFLCWCSHFADSTKDPTTCANNCALDGADYQGKWFRLQTLDAFDIPRQEHMVSRPMATLSLSNSWLLLNRRMLALACIWWLREAKPNIRHSSWSIKSSVLMWMFLSSPVAWTVPFISHRWMQTVVWWASEDQRISLHLLTWPCRPDSLLTKLVLSMEPATATPNVHTILSSSTAW